ncbi:MAG: TOBE domain-containing protein [Fibrobacteres bacterium]|nr:TOBE domain-containing protein [Fibrobacterota bacterium]
MPTLKKPSTQERPPKPEAIAGTVCRAEPPRQRRLLFSHRNQWKVVVESIHRGFLDAAVTIRLPSGVRMVAQVPLSTASMLGISIGRHFTALVDPHAILLEAGTTRPLVSCVNCLEGEVSDATEAMDTVELELTVGKVDRFHMNIPVFGGCRESFVRGNRVWILFPSRCVVLARAF